MATIILKITVANQSNTIEIYCLPSVTAHYNAPCGCTSEYQDIIICNWKYNSTDHADTQTAADDDCNTIGYTHGLWSTSILSRYSSSDQLMIKEYLNSSICDKYVYSHFFVTSLILILLVTKCLLTLFTVIKSKVSLKKFLYYKITM